VAAAAARRSFQTLDGMRGVGAAIIVMRHVPRLFWPIRVPESYLAVDLFYLVSGFVIAHAYGQRLAAGGFFWPFVKTRLIRLYPLYLIALLVGVLTATALLLQSSHSSWTPEKIGACFVIGLFMIPRFPGLPNNGTTLDGPLWTLLYELVANFVYAAIVRLLSIPVLLGIMLVSGAGIVLAELRAGTLDVGYNLTDQWAALARVGFSFFAGVLIYRLFGEKEQKAPWASWVCAATLALALMINLPRSLTPYYEVGMILVGLPLIAVAAARFEPGPATGRFFTWVGLVSYGVYCLHQPLGNLVVLGLGRVLPVGLRVLPFGILFVAAVMLLSWALDVYYDAPLRRWLRTLFFRERPRTAAPQASS
jgi:peptidoglycan/LPS O-acetylase OafA/YrhL